MNKVQQAVQDILGAPRAEQLARDEEAALKQAQAKMQSQLIRVNLAAAIAGPCLARSGGDFEFSERDEPALDFALEAADALLQKAGFTMKGTKQPEAVNQ